MKYRAVHLTYKHYTRLLAVWQEDGESEFASSASATSSCDQNTEARDELAIMLPLHGKNGPALLPVLWHDEQADGFGPVAGMIGASMLKSVPVAGSEEFGCIPGSSNRSVLPLPLES